MIKTLEAVYTGGGVWIFWGTLDNGEWFLTGDEGYTNFLNASPENFDESLYNEWLEEHTTKELEDGSTEADSFLIELLSLIEDGKYKGGSMDTYEIEQKRWLWGLEDKTYEEIEEDYCPTSDTTYLMKHTYNANTKDLVKREVVGFYSGEPNKEDTEAYKDGPIKAVYSM